MTATYVVPGLSSPAEILLDRWGVPHVYTSSREDLFVAQGFNAARDRLFQIDLWRRRGLGLLSEVFGEAYVEQDRAARLFLYRGDMHAGWLAYGSDTKRVTSAFVRGINAFVALVPAGRKLSPAGVHGDGLPPRVLGARRCRADPQTRDLLEPGAGGRAGADPARPRAGRGGPAART